MSKVVGSSIIENFDDIVIGSGITGLEIARLLQNEGRRVCVIERESNVGAGATTRNEGWLHAGTYHSAAIVNRHDAINVGRYCIEGFNRIINRYPIAISKTNASTYALLKDGNRQGDVMERWNDAKVDFKEVDLTEVLKANPEICLDTIHSSYKVKDVAINTSMLLRQMHTEIFGNSKPRVEFLLPAQILSIDPYEHEVELRYKGCVRCFRAENIIYAAGAGNKELVEKYLNMSEQIRLFRGHILIARKLSQDNFIVLDKGCPTWMNHGDFSIIGMTRMSEEVIREGYEINAKTALRIREKLQGMIKGPIEIIKTYSCLKPTITDGVYQSLSPIYFEPEVGNFVVLPGKMTEAPVVCESLLKRILKFKHHNKVAKRPIDILAENKVGAQHAVP